MKLSKVVIFRQLHLQPLLLMCHTSGFENAPLVASLEYNEQRQIYVLQLIKMLDYVNTLVA